MRLQRAFEVAEANGFSLVDLVKELSLKPARVRVLLRSVDKHAQLRLV